MRFWVPEAGGVPGLAAPPKPPKCCGPPLPAGAVFVTVMSVPTPSKVCSTSVWAAFTPADAADTVMTSPMPMARPTAMTNDCLLRRRSSRRI